MEKRLDCNPTLSLSHKVTRFLSESLIPDVWPGCECLPSFCAAQCKIESLIAASARTRQSLPHWSRNQLVCVSCPSVCSLLPGTWTPGHLESTRTEWSVVKLISRWADAKWSTAGMIKLNLWQSKRLTWRAVVRRLIGSELLGLCFVFS